MSASALSEFFAAAGTPCIARSGDPLWLDGADSVWLVVAGKLDVFLTEVRDGRPDSALRPLWRVETGQILCGLGEVAGAWGLVAIGVPDNRVLRVSRESLSLFLAQHPDSRQAYAALLDGWVGQLYSPLAGLVPADVVALQADQRAGAGQTFQQRQQTVWVAADDGDFLILGRAELPLPVAAGYSPLAPSAWLLAQSAGTVHAIDSAQLLAANHSLCGLDDLQCKLVAGFVARDAERAAGEQLRLARKAANEVEQIRGAMRRLSAILDSTISVAPEDAGSSPLLSACRLVGQASGIDFVMPARGLDDADPKRDLLAEITETSKVRRRKVALKGEWWRHENGNLLAFLGDGKRPVALLETPSGYLLHDPLAATAVPVTAALAASLGAFGFFFYRPFGDAAVKLLDLLKFGSHGNLRDYLVVGAMGTAIGLLGMVTPLAAGLLFDTVIPGAERNQLVQLTLALLASAFAMAMFEVTRGFAMLRVEGKMDSAVQAAVWDRLLRLPVPFFRDYSAGDLAVRANGINAIRQVLSGNTLHTLMSLVFSSFNLALIFYYSASLALLGLGLVLIAILVTAGASLLRLRHERKLASIQGRISGLVFQLLGGIAKLRTTGAESRAFLNWATLFARQQQHEFSATMVSNAMNAFNAVFPTLANMSFFAYIAFYLVGKESFSTGSYLAFSTAFGGFMGAMLGATSALTALLGVIPIYERARPILETAQETSAHKSSPGQLNGDIEISHLSFAYTPDGPPILKDVSLHIEAGEFVAIVGSSGSGKSTLLRLLLGFETPTSGAIYYDRQDLAGLDLGAVRRQLGVVLQNGQLLSGDIFANIIGSAATLTIDDAWEAAAQAGIADDIRAMPMGMHTLVSDGGGTLSGGQRQRLLIARAIVNRPRVVYFDEATSALDNRAQEMVSASLENLRATRIVIAHRLSTIINAKRIFVLDAGQLVQTGSYAELIGRDGLFADLARRQIA